MIFYDFEVFKYNWLVVAIDMTERKEHVIWDDPEALEKLYQEKKNDIWVGFNSNHYDQHILKGILCGFDPKKVNDFIIVNDKPGWKFSSLFKNIPLNSYDSKSGLDRDKSLKWLEGSMGNNIKESTVPFDIDRPLDEKEKEETVAYCRYDVEQTIEVFIRMVDEFNTMMFFIKHFGLSISTLSKTKAQLAANLLGGNYKGKTFKDEFGFKILDCIQLKKYRHIADWYLNPENHTYGKKQEGVVIAGVPHTFSWGGGHGAIKKYHASGVFMIVDVTAYYPSQQEKYKFGYRVMDNPENFEFIHGSNIKYKYAGDKKARLPFKIMDNAISGQMKQKSSALYDPMSNNSICINGQMLLLDLIEHLEPHVDLIQNNTDGLVLKVRDYDKDFDIIDDIVYEWECRTGMKMDFDTFFGEMFQKDVNNYLLVDHYSGAVKAKGGYVKKLNDLDYGEFPIINKALNRFMIEKIPVEETIYNCDSLKEFQLVTKIGKKYSCILHGDEAIKEKCIRVFASKDESDPGVKKVSVRTGKAEKITNSPEQCFIFNEDVNGVKCPENLDKDWYVEKAKKRLGDFGCN